MVSILPPNSTLTERALEGAMAAQFASIDTGRLRLLNDPARCPLAFLDWLAHARGVDEWDRDWPEETKRAVIAASVEVHRRKGTPAAIRTALAAAGYPDAELDERFGWDDFDGAALFDGSISYADRDHWAEYRITLPRPISVAQAAQVAAILRTVAPAHTRLKLFDFAQAANLYDSAITYDGAYTHGVV